MHAQAVEEPFVADCRDGRLKVREASASADCGTAIADIIRRRLADAPNGVLIDRRGAALGLDDPEGLIAEGAALGKALASYRGRCAMLIDPGSTALQIVGAVAGLEQASILVTDDPKEAELWLDSAIY